MWPISARVNKPENDDPAMLEPIALRTRRCLTVAPQARGNGVIKDSFPMAVCQSRVAVRHWSNQIRACHCYL